MAGAPPPASAPADGMGNTTNVTNNITATSSNIPIGLSGSHNDASPMSLVAHGSLSSGRSGQDLDARVATPPSETKNDNAQAVPRGVTGAKPALNPFSVAQRQQQPTVPKFVPAAATDANLEPERARLAGRPKLRAAPAAPAAAANEANSTSFSLVFAPANGAETGKQILSGAIAQALLCPGANRRQTRLNAFYKLLHVLHDDTKRVANTTCPISVDYYRPFRAATRQQQQMDLDGVQDGESKSSDRLRPYTPPLRLVQNRNRTLDHTLVMAVHYPNTPAGAADCARTAQAFGAAREADAQVATAVDLQTARDIDWVTIRFRMEALDSLDQLHELLVGCGLPAHRYSINNAKDGCFAPNGSYRFRPEIVLPKSLYEAQRTQLAQAVVDLEILVQPPPFCSTCGVIGAPTRSCPSCHHLDEAAQARLKLCFHCQRRACDHTAGERRSDGKCTAARTAMCILCGKGHAPYQCRRFNAHWAAAATLAAPTQPRRVALVPQLRQQHRQLPAAAQNTASPPHPVRQSTPPASYSAAAAGRLVPLAEQIPAIRAIPHDARQISRLRAQRPPPAAHAAASEQAGVALAGPCATPSASYRSPLNQRSADMPPHPAAIADARGQSALELEVAALKRQNAALQTQLSELLDRLNQLLAQRLPAPPLPDDTSEEDGEVADHAPAYREELPVQSWQFGQPSAKRQRRLARAKRKQTTAQQLPGRHYLPAAAMEEATHLMPEAMIASGPRQGARHAGQRPRAHV